MRRINLPNKRLSGHSFFSKKSRNYVYFFTIYIFFQFYFGSPEVFSLTIEETHFPKSKYINQQVSFWEKIFTHYHDDTVVIHDSIFPNEIIDVIDFRLLKDQSDWGSGNFKKDTITKMYIDRYKLAIERFSHHGLSAIKYGEIEKRIYDIYKTNRIAMKLLYQGKIKLRTQAGLANEFLRASIRAQKYLPFMEKTFLRKKIPPILTRIVFVESMFNTQARSKVGASGVWQFMPKTAKKYLKINNLVDERNSPYKATEAAARMLLRNYKKLNSWPLAITAYNHGLGGLSKAVKKIRSRDLEEIIRYYQSPSFGFASKNFYAEFYAAAKSFDRILAEKKISNKSHFHKVKSLYLLEPLTAHQLLKTTQVSKKTLLEYNQCIRNVLFTKFSHKKLPRKFEIFIPDNLARKISSKKIKEKMEYYAKSQ